MAEHTLRFAFGCREKDHWHTVVGTAASANWVVVWADKATEAAAADHNAPVKKTADPQLKTAAQRAVNCCVAWQGHNGGFRYSPKMDGDTSVSGWFIQAVKSGQMCGLNVPKKTWDGIWLNR